MQYLEIGARGFEILILLFSLVFLAGIVWRVELKLDTAYKLFFAAVVFLLVSEISILLSTSSSLIAGISYVSKVLFAILFFLGVMEMRSLLRDIDGEKENI